jgi:hypothetical protein
MSISGIGAGSPYTSAGASRLAGLGATTGSETTSGLSGAAKSIREQFLDFAQMTPAERMRAALLAKLGLKEDDLKSMGAEERKAVESKLAALIKQEVENDPDKRPGKILDISA